MDTLVGIPGALSRKKLQRFVANLLYYFDALKQMKRKPKIIQVNDGTEYSVTEPLHVQFSQVIVFKKKFLTKYVSSVQIKLLQFKV